MDPAKTFSAIGGGAVPPIILSRSCDPKNRIITRHVQASSFLRMILRSLAAESE
jgi:hypothetical protein